MTLYKSFFLDCCLRLWKIFHFESVFLQSFDYTLSTNFFNLLFYRAYLLHFSSYEAKLRKPRGSVKENRGVFMFHMRQHLLQPAASRPAAAVACCCWQHQQHHPHPPSIIYHARARGADFRCRGRRTIFCLSSPRTPRPKRRNHARVRRWARWLGFLVRQFRLSRSYPVCPRAAERGARTAKRRTAPMTRHRLHSLIKCMNSLKSDEWPEKSYSCAGITVDVNL